jgi:hypothetical protein
MNDQDLRDQINKRLTLNWLIQGAAQHAGMTFHHLVRDQISALDPRLLRLYDQFALVNLLQYWNLDAALLLGRPSAFWRRAATQHTHPFFGHPLLSRFGGMLAESARSRALERCREKGVTRLPIILSVQAMRVLNRVQAVESPHHRRLIELAKEMASRVWGIPLERLDADLVPKVMVGDLIRPRTVRFKILLAAVVGLGGVENRDGTLVVVARGTNWQLLAKELVKGTAELICLHGLNTLNDETYERVIDAADWVEYEPWMLQTGGELWRRLLAVIPTGRAIAQVLMHLARLPPGSLHSLLEAVIERPQWAGELLGGLPGGHSDDPLFNNGGG